MPYFLILQVLIARSGVILSSLPSDSGITHYQTTFHGELSYNFIISS